MLAVRKTYSDEDRDALQRALELACEALTLIDRVVPNGSVGVRGQHFVDEINDLIVAAT